MSGPENDHDLNQERELLENELLPMLEERLDGYQVENIVGEYQEQFQEIVLGERTFDEYEYPILHTAEHGVIFPEYFVVKEDLNLGYGAAIEPQTKYIKIEDDSLKDVLQELAVEWKERTGITEVDLGKADVSEVSFSHNTSRKTFAQRI